MRLSEHFTLQELTVSQEADRRGLDNTPSGPAFANLQETAQGLELVRAAVGHPIVVTSGYRSPEVNAAIGSKPSSQHVRGQAADISSPGFGNPKKLMDAIIAAKIPYDQLILEFYNPMTGRGWVHISFSAKPRGVTLAIDSNGARRYTA